MATAVPASARPSARGEAARAAARDAADLATDYRPSYLAAGIASALVFALYVLTLSPTVAMWDAGEYMAAAVSFGTPHPPGNPLFVLLGRTAALLPIAPTAAQRINLLAAISSALSAGLWFLVTERVLAGWLSRRWLRLAGASLAALIGGTAFTVWSQSVVNEKVYTISLLIVAVIAWLAIRWLDNPDGPKADRVLVLIAYLLGLGYANHMAGILPGLAVAVAVLARRPATVLRWRLILVAVAAAVLGLTPFVIQPIRAAHFPAINMGETTGCVTEARASCVFNDEAITRWKQHFFRDQYPKPGLVNRQAPFIDQVGMWWGYFKWQWLRDVHMENMGLQSILGLLFLGLGLLGGYAHWRRDRRTFWLFGPLLFTFSLLFVYLLNFKYGYTQARLLGIADIEASEVRDRDYFFIWSFSMWGVWAALGLVTIWEWIAARFGRERVTLGRTAVEEPRRRSWLLASPVLAVAFIPLITNWQVAPRSGDTVTREWARDLLNSVEPYGVLITGGDNDTYPLWYAQEVEGIRKDVTVAVTSLLGTDWYVRQMVRRPIHTYDAAKGPAIYRDREWPKPSGPPMNMTVEEAGQIPAYIELREPQVFRKESPEGTIVATIPPGIITRDQLAVLRIIKDTFPSRPLYFSRTAGNYGEQLGLDRYLLTQGFARKLLPAPVTPSQDTVAFAGEGFVDVARSYALWSSTYRGQQALLELDTWVDRASTNIPYVYVSTGALIAEALGRTGRAKEAETVFSTALQIARATRLDELLGVQAEAAVGGDTAAR